MSPLPCVIPYGTGVPVVVRHVRELLYSVYLLKHRKIVPLQFLTHPWVIPKLLINFTIDCSTMTMTSHQNND